MGKLVPLEASDGAEVDRFLSDPPHVHIYLRSRLRRPDSGRAWIHRDDGGIRGVLWLGTGQNLVLAGDDPDFALDAAMLATEVQRKWVMALGPWDVTTRFLDHYVDFSSRRPRLDRRQPFLVQTKETLPDLSEPSLGLSTEDDLLDLTVASARMSAEDFEIDPFKIDRQIVKKRMLAKIRDGRSYILRQAGYLAFKADLAVREPEGGQVEGVFTPEDLRGQGIATRCMAEIGRRALREIPVLTLHVSELNGAAVRAYEKSGYVKVDDLRLTIFPYTWGPR